MEDQIKRFAFGILSFVNAYEITKWISWSEDTNLGNNHRHTVFQAIGSSSPEFLSLRALVA